ncbi:hypothetical protein H6F47_13780 [Sphaerospermopsis sp. FACHB-1094]|uniref:hypothetical protein n=1 Tax=Sphaerospermopsis sp. FACHB-1094 TaxID=2692861 RepID=UPI00168736ED|nr:hypothetical protein [Sphaerospermopsis sp. FACHB-1094]MBD2133470.1 hypothetical protein [Sphaerospermopsis sp. FACHB-1094]
MRNKIAKASRKAQHRLAAAKRRRRQAKNGRVCSPAYQALCRTASLTRSGINGN